MTPIENQTFFSAFVDGLIKGSGTGGIVVGFIGAIGCLLVAIGVVGYVLMLLVEPIIKWHDAQMDAASRFEAEEVTDHAEPDPEYRADAPNPGRHAQRVAGRG